MHIQCFCNFAKDEIIKKKVISHIHPSHLPYSTYILSTKNPPRQNRNWFLKDDFLYNMNIWNENFCITYYCISQDFCSRYTRFNHVLAVRQNHVSVTNSTKLWSSLLSFWNHYNHFFKFLKLFLIVISSDNFQESLSPCIANGGRSGPCE